MRLAIEDTMALLDDGEAEGLCQVALAGARRAQKEGIGVLRNPPRRREFEDEGAVHLLVELEVKGVEALVAVAEARVLDPSLEQSVLAAEEFILDEVGEEIEWREFFGLGLKQPRLEADGHPRATELAQGALEFDHVHGEISWVLCAMTSR